jgi:hypothetical protein
MILCKDCKWAYGPLLPDLRLDYKTARCGRPRYQKISFVTGLTVVDGPLCENERSVGEPHCGEPGVFFEKI